MEQLALKDVYNACIAFIEMQYFMYHPDCNDLRGCDLGFWKDEPETWHIGNWGGAVRAILRVDTVCPDEKVSVQQGYRIMQRYVQDEGQEFDYEDFKKIAAAWDDARVEAFRDSKIWKDWLFCIDAVQQNKVNKQGNLLSPETLISQQQSLDIMQRFLKNCSENTTLEKSVWLEQVQGLKIDEVTPMLNEWVDCFCKKKIEPQWVVTIHDAYNTMLMFIKRQTESTAREELSILLYNLKYIGGVNDDTSWKRYSVDHAWLRAAYITLY